MTTDLDGDDKISTETTVDLTMMDLDEDDDGEPG